MNTLLVTNEIIPLPAIRAEQLLADAEALTENNHRTGEENDRLSSLLNDAQTQLELAELLGYGTDESFEPMYEQLDQIEGKIAGGKGGSGWFDKLKQEITQIFG